MAAVIDPWFKALIIIHLKYKNTVDSQIHKHYKTIYITIKICIFKKIQLPKAQTTIMSFNSENNATYIQPKITEPSITVVI
jgi:hypothetical protein